MHTIPTIAAFAAVAAAAPFKFPLMNGFPNPSPKNLALIEHNAGGSLPNTPLPTSAKVDGINTLRLIALNELYEVAYFTQLLKNVTAAGPGYTDLGDYSQGEIHEILFTVRAQEELHAYGANAILKSLKEEPIQPCEYVFPVDNFEDAIALAATFTSLVLSVLPGAQQIFAEDAGEETGLIPLVGSIIAQEGEQTGFYRAFGKNNPSAAPFLTGSAAGFALSAAKLFIVPGSCPNINLIDIPSFEPLTVIGTPLPSTTMLKCEISGTISASKNSLVYLSGQNMPVTVPISNVATSSGKTTFEAAFPFISKNFAKGLTVAAVVSGTGKSYANANDVAADTLYGPGLINIM